MKKKDLIKALFNRTSRQQPNMARGQMHIYKNQKERMQMGKSCGKNYNFFFYESYNTLPHFYKSSHWTGLQILLDWRGSSSPLEEPGYVSDFWEECISGFWFTTSSSVKLISGEEVRFAELTSGKMFSAESWGRSERGKRAKCLNATESSQPLQNWILACVWLASRSSTTSMIWSYLLLPPNCFNKTSPGKERLSKMNMHSWGVGLMVVHSRERIECRTSYQVLTGNRWDSKLIKWCSI